MMHIDLKAYIVFIALVILIDLIELIAFTTRINLKGRIILMGLMILMSLMILMALILPGNLLLALRFLLLSKHGGRTPLPCAAIIWLLNRLLKSSHVDKSIKMKIRTIKIAINRQEDSSRRQL